MILRSARNGAKIKIMNKWLIVLLAVVLLVGGYLWSFYNGLARQNQAIQAQWAQVENQFQRRYDLIPNVIASTKQIMAQEQKVFGDIAEARTKYANAKASGSQTDEIAAANEFGSTISRLLVIMENYPQLRSNETVNLQINELEGTENRIAVERGRYNDEVRAYNQRVVVFPGNLFAKMFGFSTKVYFEATNGAETAPQVNP